MRTCARHPARPPDRVTVLVEGFDPDAIGLARFLAREGNIVRLAGRGEEPDEAAALSGSASSSSRARPRRRSRPGRHRLPRRLDARGRAARRAAPRPGHARLVPRGPSARAMGRADDRDHGHRREDDDDRRSSRRSFALPGSMSPSASGARAGNLWPTGSSRRSSTEADATDRALLLELTSSHLAFMATSPTIAAVTCFWPDHLELHGSLAAYREAKETIVRHQAPDRHAGARPGRQAPSPPSRARTRGRSSRSPQPARSSEARSCARASSPSAGTTPRPRFARLADLAAPAAPI